MMPEANTALTQLLPQTERVARTLVRVGPVAGLRCLFVEGTCARCWVPGCKDQTKSAKQCLLHHPPPTTSDSNDNSDLPNTHAEDTPVT